jgi:hypothetical protein
MFSRNYSGPRVQEKCVMETYRCLNNLIVYQKFCRLNIEIGDLTHWWILNPEPWDLSSHVSP